MSSAVLYAPDDFLTAGDDFVKIHSGMSIYVTEFCKVLKGSGRMAGTDSAGTAWSSSYDLAPYNGVDAASSLVIGAGQMADLLTANGVNHQNANDQ